MKSGNLFKVVNIYLSHRDVHIYRVRAGGTRLYVHNTTIITWSEMYNTASFDAKNMIVNCLISRVEVYRGYKLHIDFKIDLGQFIGRLDIAA